MNFVTAFEALTGRRPADALENAGRLEPDAHLARVERDLDRTSDAFIQALDLLERCLPPSFGA